MWSEVRAAATISTHLSCLADIASSRQARMTQSRKGVCEDRGLIGTEAVHRKIRGSRAVVCDCALLVYFALTCGGCQSLLPPPPYSPGPHPAVRLSPED